MKSMLRKLAGYFTVIFVLLAGVDLISHYFCRDVIVSLWLKSDKAHDIQLFYRDRDDADYGADRSRQLRYDRVGELQELTFAIPARSELRSLRFDFGSEAAAFTVSEVRYENNPFMVFRGKDLFVDFAPNPHVINVRRQGNVLTFNTISGDPYLYGQRFPEGMVLRKKGIVRIFLASGVLALLLLGVMRNKRVKMLTERLRRGGQAVSINQSTVGNVAGDYRKTQIIFAFTALLLLILAANGVFGRAERCDYKLAATIEDERPVAWLSAGEVARQKFTATQDDMSGVGVFFALWTKWRGDGKLNMSLRDVTADKVIGTTVIEQRHMATNEFARMAFATQYGSRGREYELTLSMAPVLEPGNVVGMFLNNRGGGAEINGKKNEHNNISIASYYGNTEAGRNRMWLLGGISLLALIFFRYIYRGAMWLCCQAETHPLRIAGLLWLAGMVILIWRNNVYFQVPQLYTEDGRWSLEMLSRGFGTYFIYARSDYFVWGNIILLWLAWQINRIFFVENLSCLPYCINLVQFAFYALAAALPLFCFRRQLGAMWRLLLWWSLLLLPIGGFEAYEIFGRISNIGYLCYFMVFCLLFNVVFNCGDGKKSGERIFIAVAVLFTIVAAMTNSACSLLVFLFWVACLGKDGFAWPVFRCRLFGLVSWALFFCGMAIGALLLVQRLLLSQSLLLTKEGGVALDWEVAVEFLSRCLLYNVIAPFYLWLTVTRAVVCLLGLLLVIVAAIVLTRRREDFWMFGVTLTGLAFFIVVTGYFRPFLYACMLNFSGLYPYRYFYGIAFVSLTLLMMALSVLWARGNGYGRVALLLFGFYMLLFPLWMRLSPECLYGVAGMEEQTLTSQMARAAKTEPVMINGEPCHIVQNVPWKQAIPARYLRASMPYKTVINPK